MNASEIHSAIQRLETSWLVHCSEMNEKPNLSALEEFLIHGVKYAFPAERGGMTRGMPTSYASEPLCRLIKASTEPVPVWADPGGTTRGVALAPFYKTVPEAAKLDSLLYKRLALIDAIRDRRARERNPAEKELKNSMQSATKIYDSSKYGNAPRCRQKPRQTCR